MGDLKQRPPFTLPPFRATQGLPIQGASFYTSRGGPFPIEKESNGKWTVPQTAWNNQLIPFVCGNRFLLDIRNLNVSIKQGFGKRTIKGLICWTTNPLVQYQGTCPWNVRLRLWEGFPVAFQSGRNSNGNDPNHPLLGHLGGRHFCTEGLHQYVEIRREARTGLCSGMWMSLDCALGNWTQNTTNSCAQKLSCLVIVPP